MSHTSEDQDVIDFLSDAAHCERQSDTSVGVFGNDETADALQFLADNYTACKAGPEMLEFLISIREPIWTYDDLKRLDLLIAKATGETE